MTSNSVAKLLTRFIVISDFCNDSHNDSEFYSLFKSYWLCELGLFIIIICSIIVSYDL